MENKGFIPTHGNYKELISYRKSKIIYDSTVLFCKKFLRKYDRTIDQMVQAARSGKQNIIKGSMASGTSKETEIKLINVARASLEELLEDYHDFLRTGNHKIWEKNSKEALYVRKLAYKPDESYETYKTFIETRPPETVANILICLINQCNYLLDRQLKKLEQDFLKNGGLREAMQSILKIPSLYCMLGNKSMLYSVLQNEINETNSIKWGRNFRKINKDKLQVFELLATIFTKLQYSLILKLKLCEPESPHIWRQLHLGVHKSTPSVDFLKSTIIPTFSGSTCIMQE